MNLEISSKAEPLKIKEASLHLLAAFDIGFEIRLSQIPVIFGARQRITNGYSFLARSIGRETQPICITWDPIRLRIGDRDFDFQTYLTFFDVGSMSFELTAPLDVPIESLPSLTSQIHASRELISKLREMAEKVFQIALPSIVTPSFFPTPSIFSVVNIQKLNEDLTYQAVIERLGPTIAKTLRTSDEAIGQNEVMRTLNPYVTYSDQDIVFTSSNVAVIFDETSFDVVDIFEILNMQFLELRFIDARLDKSLQDLYVPTDSSGSLKRVWEKLPIWVDSDSSKLNTIHLDSTIITERVELSFKFANDSYLVRIYELCVQKMFLNSYSRGIERKLKSVRDIMNDRRDRASSSRMEFLEWLIILLIAVDVVPRLLKFFFGSE